MDGPVGVENVHHKDTTRGTLKPLIHRIMNVFEPNSN